jgi:fibronectin-binding autotransporter adhesin
VNHVFRIVWSKALGTWVVVSELATRCGKGGGVDKRVAATTSLLERIAAGN